MKPLQEREGCMDREVEVTVREHEDSTGKPFRVLTLNVPKHKMVTLNAMEYTTRVCFYGLTDDDLRAIASACGEAI